MDQPTPCPPADALQRLLLGLGDPRAATEFESHLAACPACAARAGALAAEDDLVRMVRRAGAADEHAPALAEALSAVFRQLPAGADGATASWSGPRGSACPSGTGADAERIGPYEVRERLGAGGMGVVYRAFDPALHREVAVKVIRADLLADPAARDRFLAEARAAAAVEHENIAAVHAVEVHDGRPCLVMPLLRGETLERRLRAAGRPLPLGELAALARGVAAGLEAAHAAGLVHRDVKPANVWLAAPDGRAKLLDFGLAVAAGTAGRPAGTPGYMAPEQVRGAPADARADLFSLGCVLYRAAAGAPPFGADTTPAVLVHTIARDPAPVGAANPALPARLAALIGGLLEKDPARRPGSAGLVLAELDAIGADVAAARRRRARRQWLTGVVTAAVVGGLGTWLLRSATPAVAPPEPVTVDVVADPDLGRVVFTRDGTDHPFDPAAGKPVALVPGVYAARPAAPAPGRRMVPGSVTVGPGGPRVVKLALVGEVDCSKAHDQTLAGVAAVLDRGKLRVLSAGRDRILNEWRPGGGAAPPARLDGPAVSFAATPDGAVAVTGGGDRQSRRGQALQFWDGRTLKPLGDPLPGHARFITAVAVTADGKRALSCDADATLLWDVAKRESRALLDGDGPRDARVSAAALDGTGKRALTGDESGRVVLWDLSADPPKPSKRLAAAAGEGSAVRAVLFTADGFVTAGDDGAVRVWAGAPLKAREFPAQRTAVTCLALSPDGRRLLAGTEGGSVLLWPVAGAGDPFVLTGHEKKVTAVAFTPDGRGAVSGSEDSTVRLWRLPFE